MNPLLDELILMLAFEFVADGLPPLLVDAPLLVLVVLDALDVDFEGALNGVLEHEVADRGAAFVVLGYHLYGELYS